VIQLREIDDLQHCLDELHESMSSLYDSACTQHDIDQIAVVRYWAQVTKWTDRYMRGLADLRQSATQQEWEERVRALAGFYLEGSEIRDDFRTWLVNALTAQIDEYDRKRELFRIEHPIQYYVVDPVFGAIFDSVSWVLKRVRGRGLLEE
jgi:hypothetical protein